MMPFVMMSSSLWPHIATGRGIKSTTAESLPQDWCLARASRSSPVAARVVMRAQAVQLGVVRLLTHSLTCMPRRRSENDR